MDRGARTFFLLTADVPEFVRSVGAAVAAAGGGEKWNSSTLGAQLEEDVSSSRNTTRERPSSVTGKSGIVEMFPEGKP